MKIDKSEFVKRISVLEKVIPSKPTIACMEGILVRDGRMCANDLQNAISIATPEAEDECFILPKKAIAMAKSLPDGLVQITPQADHSIVIRSGAVKAKMISFDPDKFPENHVLEDADETMLDIDDLCDMLSSVAYATAAIDSRPVQTGVLLDGDGQYLNVVACDGFRSAWAKMKYDEPFNMIIPKSTVKLILSVREGEKIGIQKKGEKAVFTIGNYQIFSRLLVGNFFDYKRIFPTRQYSIGVEREALLDAMRRIMICSDDTKKGRVVMDGSGMRLKIVSSLSSTEYVEEIEVKDEFKSDMKVMFNATYFIDALKSYGCNVVDCYFGEKSTDPTVLDDGQLKTLILPVRMVSKT